MHITCSCSGNIPEHAVLQNLGRHSSDLVSESIAALDALNQDELDADVLHDVLRHQLGFFSTFLLAKKVTVGTPTYEWTADDSGFFWIRPRVVVLPNERQVTEVTIHLRDEYLYYLDLAKMIELSETNDLTNRDYRVRYVTYIV